MAPRAAKNYDSRAIAWAAQQATGRQAGQKQDGMCEGTEGGGWARQHTLIMLLSVDPAIVTDSVPTHALDASPLDVSPLHLMSRQRTHLMSSPHTSPSQTGLAQVQEQSRAAKSPRAASSSPTLSPPVQFEGGGSSLLTLLQSPLRAV